MYIFFVSFRGQKTLGPRPDRSPLGVSFKISDEHPHPFHMRSSPRPRVDGMDARSLFLSPQPLPSLPTTQRGPYGEESLA